MWIKNLFRTLIFGIVFVVLLGRIYNVLSWKDTAGDYISSLNSYYELEEDIVDVVFLGSSHCYCSVNHSILWDEHGISSFSLAISGQDLASTYHCLVESLKTQSPEVVMIEMYGSVFQGYQDTGNLYRNTLSLKPSKNAYNAVKSMVEEGTEWDYLLKWPIVHTRYAELKKQDFQKNTIPYVGYTSDFETNSILEIVPYTGEPAETLWEESEYWIQKMIDFAKESQTNICFFIAPYSAPDYEQMRIKRAEQIAKANNIPFVNMIDISEDLGMDVENDFMDWMHTNVYGAEKVTNYLGEYLKQNYELENHYGDPKYELWDKDLLARQHEMLNVQMAEITNVAEYLEMAGNLDEYTVIVTTNGQYQGEGADLPPALGALGIGSEFYQAPYLWIIQNQEMIYAAAGEEIFYHMDMDKDEVLIGSSQGVKNVIVGEHNYCAAQNGINVVIYDNVLEKVADAVGFDAGSGYAAIR